MTIDNAVMDEIYKTTIIERKAFPEDSKEWHYYTGIINIIETLQTIDLSNNNDSLKDYALSIIDDLEEDGYNLEDGAWLLQWKYDERPDVKVTLIVGDYEDIEESKPGDYN
jgi:hypothetical protein